jgi:hypothetical protein
VFINGAIKENTKENGLNKKFKVWASIHGLMANLILVSTIMTKKRVLESIFCKMAENMKVGGLMASSMVLELSLFKIVSFSFYILRILL